MSRAEIKLDEPAAFLPTTVREKLSNQYPGLLEPFKIGVYSGTDAQDQERVLSPFGVLNITGEAANDISQQLYKYGKQKIDEAREVGVVGLTMKAAGAGIDGVVAYANAAPQLKEWLHPIAATGKNIRAIRTGVVTGIVGLLK